MTKQKPKSKYTWQKKGTTFYLVQLTLYVAMTAEVGRIDTAMLHISRHWIGGGSFSNRIYTLEVQGYVVWKIVAGKSFKGKPQQMHNIFLVMWLPDSANSGISAILFTWGDPTYVLNKGWLISLVENGSTQRTRLFIIIYYYSVEMIEASRNKCLGRGKGKR